MTEADPNVDPVDPPEDEDPPEGEYTPPTREEHAKMVAALAARKKEAASARRELAAAKEAAAGKEKETAPDPDLKVKRQGVIAALTAEGMTREQAKVAVRLVDLGNVTVDDDGDADVEDELDTLRTTFPHLFTKAEGGQRQRAPKVTTADKGGKSGVVTDPTGDRLLRSAGYKV